MIETVENLRKDYAIPRDEQDELAVASHRKAAAAAASGKFADETVPVTVPGRREGTLVEADDHIRPDTSMETLAKLRPILGTADPESTVGATGARILATMLRELDRRSGPVRAGDDVHRRRSGPDRDLRATVVTDRGR